VRVLDFGPAAAAVDILAGSATARRKTAAINGTNERRFGSPVLTGGITARVAYGENDR
jgi:hypothetical protein